MTTSSSSKANNQRENPFRKYFKPLIITAGVTATLITLINKGPEYINTLNPARYEKNLELLKDSTFQKGYLKQRAESGEKFLIATGENYNPRKLEKYLDAIYGKNPLK